MPNLEGNPDKHVVCPYGCGVDGTQVEVDAHIQERTDMCDPAHRPDSLFKHGGEVAEWMRAAIAEAQALHGG